MIDLDSIWRWWLQAMLTGSIVLAVGSVAVAITRAPVYRVRLVIWTLGGALVAPWLVGWPGVALWSLPAWSSARVVRLVEPVDRRIDLTNARGSQPNRPRVMARPGPIESSLSPNMAAQPILPQSVDPRRVVLVAWGLGGVAWLGWWIVGQGLLWGLLQASWPAGKPVQERFLRIAGPGGSRVRLLASDRVALPFTFTWIQPTILLPAGLGNRADSDDLSFALAHEWSHVERRDHLSWTLNSLAGTLCYPHPCFWYLRRRLHSSQDFLADDRAAGLVSPAEFAAYLVRLARTCRDRAFISPPALGIGGRRSDLTRRVTMLLADRPPHMTRCRPAWTTVGFLSTIMTIVSAASVRLDAAPELDRPRQDPVSLPPTAPDSGQTETINARQLKRPVPADLLSPPSGVGEWVGKIVDKQTGQPIAGANVRVKVSTSRDPETNAFLDLRSVEATTPADGSYRFTITPDEATNRFLYVTLYVKQADHVSYYGGYSYEMILKNIGLGERPFFEKLELDPARAVEGWILTPDGAPAAGVKINAFSRLNVPRGGHEFGTFSDTRTDSVGRFRLPLHPTGEAVFWILPEQFEPSTHPLSDNRRGDLGTFRLKPGLRIKGRVLDEAGKPVGRIYVGADRADSKYGDGGIPSGVADNIQRSVVTSDDGTFTLAPLPAGVMKVKPNETGWDPATRNDAIDPGFRPLPGVFLPQSVTLVEGKEPEPIIIQAVPRVAIAAQLTDSKGEKKGGFETWINGKLDGQFWSGQCKPSPDGHYAMIAPRGLKDAEFDLMSNEHATMMYRMGKGEPLRYDRRVKLGTLDHDIGGIEIIRFVSPIILIRATTRDGQPVKGLKAAVNLIPAKKTGEGPYILNGRVRSDIYLEGPQEDGRFRTSQLPPDTEVEVKVMADEFAEATRKVILPEGKTEEVAFVLEPK